jgi:hypothetical protein
MAFVRLARVLLAMFFVLSVAFALSPVVRISQVSSAACAIFMFMVGFIGVTLTLASAPWHRKNSLFSVIMLLLLGLILIRSLLGFGDIVVETPAGILGLAAAFVPIGAARLREHARQQPQGVVGVIIMDTASRSRGRAVLPRLTDKSSRARRRRHSLTSF